MAKKKDFSVGGPVPGPVIPIARAETLRQFVPTVSLPLPHGPTKNYDFSEHLGRGYDDTVQAIVGVLSHMIDTGQPEPYTLRTGVESGLAHWFRFCAERASNGRPPTLASIDTETMEDYAGWLSLRLKADGDRWSSNTARTVYAKTKTFLEGVRERRLLPQTGLFPRNLFPRATSVHMRRQYIRPLSDSERERVLRPLSLEVAQIFDGRHASSLRTQLGLCVFAVLLKTGLNPTPFLEIPRVLKKCFIDHPRINRKVLVTFKRRAGKHVATPLEPAETKVVSLDVYKLCVRVEEMTRVVADLAVGTPLDGRLWLYQLRDGSVRGLSVEELSSIADSFTAKHKLLRDDDTRLKMTSQLFRNTKLNRIWRVSKGDLLATARSAGNTPRVAGRYLSVAPAMLEEHRLAGEVLVDTLTLKVQRENTPHSGCKDTINGELAPKDGSHCIDFLSCFRCKSQVVIGEDLHKLFSFYWALLEERSRIGSSNWRKAFRWIVRVIDREIAPKFDARLVKQEKARARTDRHPMWRSKTVLAALRSVL